MDTEEAKMLVYVELADLARRRKQAAGSDRFLVLAGAAACRAGWPEVSARCRRLVLADNPSHLLGKWDTFAEALRDSDFEPFLKRVESFCPLERAELILHELDASPTILQDCSSCDDEDAETARPGETALATLSAAHWKNERGGKEPRTK